MTSFDVKLRIDEKNLAWFLALIAGERRVALSGVVPTTGEKTPKSRYVNGKHDKGITGPELVLASLRNSPMLAGDFDEVFVDRGFSKESVGPNLSKLLSAGRIRKDSDGTYHLVKGE